jgi:hypothetical protein
MAANARPISAIALALALVACSKPASPPPPPEPVSIPEPSKPASPAAQPSSAAGKRAAAQAAKLAAAASPAPTTATAPPATKIADDDLKVEEPEANPYSDEITLKISVTPAVKALAMWGAKQIAKLAPGSMDAEIVRPRGSGPVDLEIKADGFMPYHTRLYSDRNDKVNVRLYRAEEAPGLFGYKRSTNPTEKKK